MIEEYCKCKYSISPQVRLRLSSVICHLPFLISRLSFPISFSYKLTEKYFFNELIN